MQNGRLARRSLIKALTSAALAAPFASLAKRAASAASAGVARRVIFFYFPDGVPAVSQSGEPSLWHATGSGNVFQLSDIHTALLPFKEKCVFFNGLTMGPTDAGSHPGGAQKLLTASDHADGASIDQVLARALGVPLLYLGAMATEGISYPAPGTAPAAAENNPRAAFDRLFPGGLPPSTTPPPGITDPNGPSILDTVLADMNEMSSAWAQAEKTKLDLHMSALRELERKVKAIPGADAGTSPPASCANPRLGAYDASAMNAPANFPAILRAQTDLMVQAMACNLTRVGLLQCSVHTSELNMAAFAGTPMFIPNYYLGSHKASHYGTTHNEQDELFRAFHQQVRWWVDQFAYLLQSLASRPEDGGTMLDHSLVVLCTEVCDGNTHNHDNMPFILAGGGSGAIRSGRILQLTDAPHAGVYAAIAHAMGTPMKFGQANSEPIAGLLT
jgi:Protein of unknown function (DUF1552)